MESKKNILNSLSISKNFTNKDIFGLANVIRGTALENNIPKEDSLMNLKDLKKIMRTTRKAFKRIKKNLRKNSKLFKQTKKLIMKNNRMLKRKIRKLLK